MFFTRNVSNFHYQARHYVTPLKIWTRKVQNSWLSKQITVQNLTSGSKKNQNFLGLAKEKSGVMCLIMVSFLVKTQQNKLTKRFFTVLRQGKVLTNYVQIYHHYHLYFKEKFKNIFFFKNNSKIYKKGKNTQYCWFAILEIKNIPQKWNFSTGRHKMNWNSEYDFHKTTI